jgi:hypothetical protein
MMLFVDSGFIDITRLQIDPIFERPGRYVLRLPAGAGSSISVHGDAEDLARLETVLREFRESLSAEGA